MPISCGRTSGETVTPGTNAGSMLIVSPLSLTIVTLFVRSRSRIRSVIFPTSPGASWIVALVASGLFGSERPPESGVTNTGFRMLATSTRCDRSFRSQLTAAGVV